jgi:hypothetical protein
VAALGLDGVERMVASTLAACSPPMTLMRELGQVNRNRGL